MLHERVTVLHYTFAYFVSKFILLLRALLHRVKFYRVLRIAEEVKMLHERVTVLHYTSFAYFVSFSGNN